MNETYQDFEGYTIYDKEWFQEKPLVISVDFDGTCVTHDYPKIGQEIGAVEVLKELCERGHKLILFTMRDGHCLDDAVRWFHNHQIPLYGIQTNPTQSEWTSSPKCYANVHIDDSALGCPLTREPEKSQRPFVDWNAVKMMLMSRNIL